MIRPCARMTGTNREMVQIFWSFKHVSLEKKKETRDARAKSR